MIPIVKIDTTGLNRALTLAQEYSKRTPAQAVNTSACEIAIAAKNYMPYSGIPRIDAELSVITTPKIGKRGKPLKKAKVYSGGKGTAQNAAVPLAVLIIQARARPSSNYNHLTNMRYYKPSPFKGVSPAQGRAAMAAAEHRLIASRHSGNKFLLAGWIPVIRAMLPYSMNKFRRGSAMGPPLAESKSFHGANLGEAAPAQQGTYNATCIIENLIGYEGRNAASFDRALQLHGAPGLQRAVDNEGAKAMDYYLQKSYKEELEGPFNRAAS